MTTPGPIGARRRLGAELRRLRHQSGMHLDEVAAKVPCSTSKISRLETGKGVPKLADIRSLITIYEVGTGTEHDMLLRLARDSREHGWWEEHVDGVQPERFVLDSPGRFAAVESDATAVRSFDLSVVPGMLQTRDYARIVLASTLPHHPQWEIERLVDLRMQRQEALVRVDRAPLDYHAVLDEAVLHRRVGAADVMDDQLATLVRMAQLPNVTIQIVPFDAGHLRAHGGHFMLLNIPSAYGSDLVFIESQAGDTYLDAEVDVDLYEDVFADTLTHALSPDASLGVIGRMLPPRAPRQEGSTAR